MSVLGKCIGILAEKSSGKNKTAVVPYRESKLTHILKNALGGNSKTSMIAALSPASVNYDETLSTLRYAWQVKAIKNEAKVNESAQDKLIRELREENERLKKGGGGAGGGGAIDPKMQEEIEMNRKLIEDFKRQEEEYKMRLEQQQAANKKKMEEEQMLKTTPHLKNINADPLMSGQITCMLRDGRNTIGKKDPNGAPVAVQIAGAGIVVNHANIKFDKSSNASTIYPNEEDPQKSKVTVNGELLVAPREL